MTLVVRGATLPGLLAVGALALGAAPSAAAGARSGKVTYVTAGAAFLDVGAQDGLTAGARLELVRRRAKVGACEVTGLAAHHATCKSDRASIGDRFSFAPAARTTAPAAVRPKLPDAATIEAQRKLVDAAAPPKVTSPRQRRALGAVWGTRGSVGVRQQAWATLGHDDAAYARTVLNGSARADIGFLPGLSAGGSLRLVADELQPAAARFRPGEPAELYVWEAAVVLDDGRGPLVARVGRFVPRKAPGATLLDGAQAGFRAFGGSLEVGAYGGVIPDLVTLRPSVDRLTTGVTLAFDSPLGKDLLLLPRARVALIATPDFTSMRAETEAQAQLLWGTLVAAGASVKAGLDARTVAPSFDAARVDVDVRPGDWLRVGAGYRYLGPPAQDFDAAEGVPDAPGAHHGDVSATWSTTPWLALGARAGVAGDAEYGELRGYAGPEVRLPQLLGGLGGLGVGYTEELGAFSGRTGYVHADFAPFSVLSMWARAAYLETAGQGDPLREGALFTGLDAPLLPWLSLRARAHTLMALPAFDKSARATPTVLAVDAGAAVSW
ncbi:MAG: hypothetical protein HYS27_18380 [Deltaproteobacteria bacterium]|nr:hypothetical protein [Deltaproteobacteria bacterium]